MTINISVNRVARRLDEYLYMEVMQEGGPKYFAGNVKGVEPWAFFSLM
jgi:hypothetical protein